MGLCCSDMRSEDHHLDDVSHSKSFSPRNGNSINNMMLENEEPEDQHHQNQFNHHHHRNSSSSFTLPESINLHSKTPFSLSRGANSSSSNHKHKKASLITTSLRTHVHSCSEGEAEDEEVMMEGNHSPSASSRNKKKKKKKSRSKKNNDSVSSSSGLMQQLKKSNSEKAAAHHVLDITSSFAQNSPRSNYYYYEDVMPTTHDDEDVNESSADEASHSHHPTAIPHLNHLNHPHHHHLSVIPHSNSTTASYSSVVKYSSIIRNKIESASGSLSGGYPQSASHHSNHPHHQYPTPSPSLLTLSLQQQQIQQHMEAKRKQGNSRRTLSEYQTENAESKPITTALSFTEMKAGPVTSKQKSALDYKKQQQVPLVQLQEDSEEEEDGEDIEISDDESSSMDSEEKLDKIQQQQTGTIRKHPRKDPPPQKLSVDASSTTNSWFTIPNNLPKVNRVKTSTKSSSKNQVDANTTLLFKVILLGDSSVGKSACLSRIEGNAFSNLTRKTVGLEFTTRLIDNTGLHQNAAASPNSHISMTSSPPGGIAYPTKHKIQLQFWDMGYDSYSEEALFNAYLKDVQAIICVYSINSVSSFERLKQLWNTQVLPQLLKNCYLPHVKIVLLGNKTDLDGERSVDYSQGLEFARAMNRSMLNAIYSVSPTNNNSQQSLDKVAANSSEFMTELKTTKNEPFANTSVSLEDNSLTANSSSSVDDCDRVDAVKFFECSAKTGQNIETATQTLAYDLDTYFSSYL
ncbi:hypothetical protein FDP41_001618 [Naegleria fowleri]|uniref:Uncharacterized protein n=1 Tax=Naegleria fowleri TaxID=5763 RepID=A0A6A5C167_NAEFO|nr:uncharacterized protein FDP41_001618 [Naegleria fowleri]KAF0979275.1 hypothetical protein FDP41_001618 [Naegleria fowleri]CAG4719383.1 unnamed protein product [Naegleria fowleri]